MDFRRSGATALLAGGIAAGLVALHDYVTDPPCAIPAQPCGPRAPAGCGYFTCPGPAVHWWPVAIVGLVIALLGAALTLANHEARSRAS